DPPGAPGGFVDKDRDGLNDDGKVRLLAFDPAQDRLIEVVGDLNEGTKNIITSVPGTSASMNDFYENKTQKMGTALVSGHPDRVAFIWKDGQFPPTLVG